MFINTLVVGGGGAGQNRGGGEPKKFSVVKGGQKSLAKLKIKIHNLLLKLTGSSLKLYLVSIFHNFPGPFTGPALYLLLKGGLVFGAQIFASLFHPLAKTQL